VLEQACSKLLTSKEGVTHQSLTRETLFTGQQKGEHERNGIRVRGPRGAVGVICVWGGRKGVVGVELCGSPSTLGCWKHKQRLIIKLLNTQTHMALIRQVLLFGICALASVSPILTLLIVTS